MVNEYNNNNNINNLHKYYMIKKYIVTNLKEYQYNYNNLNYLSTKCIHSL